MDDGHVDSGLLEGVPVLLGQFTVFFSGVNPMNSKQAGEYKPRSITLVATSVVE